jgi:hypothetical protein
VAPPPDPTAVDDDDNSYLLDSVNGQFVLDPTIPFPASEHDFAANGGAVTGFSMNGISVGGFGLDPTDPTAFPAFLRINLTAGTATVTMTPVPEPAGIALIGSLLVLRTTMRARPRSQQRKVGN